MPSMFDWNAVQHQAQAPYTDVPSLTSAYKALADIQAASALPTQQAATTTTPKSPIPVNGGMAPYGDIYSALGDLPEYYDTVPQLTVNGQKYYAESPTTARANYQRDFLEAVLKNPTLRNYFMYGQMQQQQQQQGQPTVQGQSTVTTPQGTPEATEGLPTYTPRTTRTDPFERSVSVYEAIPAKAPQAAPAKTTPPAGKAAGTLPASSSQQPQGQPKQEQTPKKESDQKAKNRAILEKEIGGSK